jgi:N,N'-diacetyllegionaminate synthase
MKVLIIAEAGVNHNGDLDLAKKLIDVASDAGADLVKFQTFNADRLVTENASKADYQKLAGDNNESQQSMLRKLELTEAMHHELMAHCAMRGIGFFSTGFDRESIDLLASLGQELFKIPSGEITNLPYLRHIGKLKKKVILSTGMSSMDEIECALNALEESGTPRVRVTVLHCTTAYPAPMSDINLRAMQSIRTKFGVNVGYSDHTLGIEIPIAAVALGARIIEKHFTIDRNLPGPDHRASLEPAELKSMVCAIRNIEVALGDGTKRLMPSEIGNRETGRKSIVASQTIKTGELFTESNLTSKRPGTGISPMEWDHVLGTRATENYFSDDLLKPAEVDSPSSYLISGQEG